MSLRRKARPIWRPGETPALPKGWPKLARAIRVRDAHHCRHCGHPAPGGPVDHLVPRKLLVADEVACPENLALLCLVSCHPWKTMRLEPKLYKGDVLAFNLFLSVVAGSGPVPSAAFKARAYKRLTKQVEERK